MAGAQELVNRAEDFVGKSYDKILDIRRKAHGQRYTPLPVKNSGTCPLRPLPRFPQPSICAPRILSTSARAVTTRPPWLRQPAVSIAREVWGNRFETTTNFSSRFLMHHLRARVSTPHGIRPHAANRFIPRGLPVARPASGAAAPYQDADVHGQAPETRPRP